MSLLIAEALFQSEVEPLRQALARTLRPQNGLARSVLVSNWGRQIRRHYPHHQEKFRDAVAALEPCEGSPLTVGIQSEDSGWGMCQEMVHHMEFHRSSSLAQLCLRSAVLNVEVSDAWRELHSDADCKSPSNRTASILNQIWSERWAQAREEIVAFLAAYQKKPSGVDLEALRQELEEEGKCVGLSIYDLCLYAVSTGLIGFPEQTLFSSTKGFLEALDGFLELVPQWKRAMRTFLSCDRQTESLRRQLEVWVGAIRIDLFLSECASQITTDLAASLMATVLSLLNKATFERVRELALIPESIRLGIRDEKSFVKRVLTRLNPRSSHPKFSYDPQNRLFSQTRVIPLAEELKDLDDSLDNELKNAEQILWGAKFAPTPLSQFPKSNSMR